MINLRRFITIYLICLLSACTNSSQQEEQLQTDNQENKDTVTPIPEEKVLSAAVTKKIESGAEVYNAYCMACHQKDGNGVPGNFPPLRDTEWVNGEKATLISIVLNGLEGPIEVNGEPYNNAMTAHNFLNDDEVAAVLTYIRNSFGNTASEVSAEEVAALRNSTKANDKD